MMKTKAVVLGVVAGIVAEIGALVLSFAGTNLFHGGHPNIIANALLPGLGVLDRLSAHVPRYVPASIAIVSLTQFPVYGALLGRDYANRRVSRLTLAAVLLHMAGASLAFYGVKLDRDWRNASEQYAACVRANPAAEELTLDSRRIAALVVWRDQSKSRLAQLRTEKEHGASFQPDPEEYLVREIAQWQQEIDQRWESYKRAGGPTSSPEAVQEIASPCGKPPQRPVFP